MIELTLKQWVTFLRNAMIVLFAVLMLVGCDNPEKSDLQEIAQTFMQSEFIQGEAQFKRKIANAKNAVEISAAFKEISDSLGKLPGQLDALALKTEEGKSIRAKLSEATARMAPTLGQAGMIGYADKQAQLAWSRELEDSKNLFIDALMEFAEMAKKEGIELDTSMLSALQQ